MPQPEARGPPEGGRNGTQLERERGERGRREGERPRDRSHRDPEKKPAHHLVDRKPPAQPKQDGPRERASRGSPEERESGAGGGIDRRGTNDRGGHGESGEKLCVDSKIQHAGMERP